MAITLVEVGEKVELNCTPTLNVLNVNFSGPPEVLQKYPPVNNVLTFPANLSYQGDYSCFIYGGGSGRFIEQVTYVAVLPGN